MGRCASCAIKRRVSFDVLHLKREMRSKSLIFMAYRGCRPAFPPRFTPQDAWAAGRRHATATALPRAHGGKSISRPVFPHTAVCRNFTTQTCLFASHL